jgi:hypothetical protein
VWRFEAGRGVGEGALWNPERTCAWRLMSRLTEDGEVLVTRAPVSLDDAAAIAARLGVTVPRRPSVGVAEPSVPITEPSPSVCLPCCA